MVLPISSQVQYNPWPIDHSRTHWYKCDAEYSSKLITLLQYIQTSLVYMCMGCVCACVLDNYFLMFNDNCSWATHHPLLHMLFHFCIQVTEGEAPIWDWHLHGMPKRKRLGRTTQWSPRPLLGWRSFISTCQSISRD